MLAQLPQPVIGVSATASLPTAGVSVLQFLCPSGPIADRHFSARYLALFPATDKESSTQDGIIDALRQIQAITQDFVYYNGGSNVRTEGLDGLKAMPESVIQGICPVSKACVSSRSVLLSPFDLTPCMDIMPPVCHCIHAET